MCRDVPRAEVWPCLPKIFLSWIHKATTSTRSINPTLPHEDNDIVCYSDACPTGYGVLVFWRSKCFVTAGAYTQHEHICLLEGRAFLYAVKFIIALGIANPTATTIRFYVDNTSVIGAFERGRSQNFILNRIIERIHRSMEQICKHYSLRYITSSKNLADSWSRLPCYTNFRELNNLTSSTETIITDSQFPIHIMNPEAARSPQLPTEQTIL